MTKKIEQSLMLFLCLVFSAGIASASVKFSPLNARRHSSRAQIPTLSQGGSETLLPDGRILLLGGEGRDGVLGTASVLDPSTGTVTTLATTLVFPRAWHSATLLPDGTVLIFGGIGTDGSAVNAAESFVPETEAFAKLPPTGLASRAYHSATVLTDGRVLIAGGIDFSGRAQRTLEVWDYRSRKGISLPGVLATPRSKHAATLLADGTVLFWGGVDANGSSLNYGEVFEPATQGRRLQTSPIQPADDPQAPHVEESNPADSSTDVPIDTIPALRFSKPLNIVSVNRATVILNSSQGDVEITVVPTEGAMLAFITPKQALEPGTAYTLSLNGLTDNQGQLLPATQIFFTTSGAPSEAGALGTGGPNGAGSDPLNSAWRKLPPLKAAPGVTALAGQVLTLDGEPLSKVTLEIEGGDTTRTDQTGRFLLERLTSGHHVMWINGQTANSREKTYGVFEVGVEILPGQTNVLNYTIWMPVLDMANATTISFPTQEEVVVKSPVLPGLELHLPPQTTILDRNGKVVDKISITPIPLNHPPFPRPARVSVPLYFTIQPGGAYVKVDNPDGPRGARLFYPNSFHHPAGSVFNFWDYDADQKGWFVYGQGAVSADQTQVIPSAGVEIYELTGAMVSTGFAPAVGPKPG